MQDFAGTYACQLWHMFWGTFGIGVIILILWMVKWSPVCGNDPPLNLPHAVPKNDITLHCLLFNHFIMYSYMKTALWCWSNFKVRNHIYLKHQFELINHEVFLKTSRFTSLMTKSLRFFSSSGGWEEIWNFWFYFQ